MQYDDDDDDDNRPTFRDLRFQLDIFSVAQSNASTFDAFGWATEKISS